MAKVLVVANQKGGEAKTTTAHTIGSGLRLRGYRVLFIDLDGQCNLSHTLQVINVKKTALELLQGEINAKETIIKTSSGDVIAGSTYLNALDITLKGAKVDKRLRDALEPIKQDYDFIVIDTPPALGIRTINAFTVADYLVIPAQADVYSLQGIGQLNGTIETVRNKSNKNLKIGGIVLTRYNGRAVLNRNLAELIEETAESIGTKVYKSMIREAVAVKEAKASLQSILEYAPKSNPAKDYNALIDEILEDLGL